MENVSEATHSNKNSLCISGEDSAGLSVSAFGLPRTHTEYVQLKPPISYYTAIILNYRNVAKHL